MSIDVTQLTARSGYAEGDANQLAPEAADLVASYKAQVCRRYVSLNGDQLEKRLTGTDFQVTRKYDGELAVLFFDGEHVYTINTGGRLRAGLDVHREAAQRLAAAGLTEAVIAAELYVAEDAGRTRVFDVTAALADPARHGELRLAAFDIISLGGQPHTPRSYVETHAELSRIFTGPVVTPVQREQAASRAVVAQLYQQWVTDGGAEGLVVRSDLPLVYKVKPTFTLDAAVIGYSENPDAVGQVRSLLVALVTDDGRYTPVGHVGSGLTEATRADFHALLSPAEVASSYIETDANHVAFHMVKPTVVVEVKVNDVLFESPSGQIRTPLLEFDSAWARTGTAPGISIVHPVLLRVRDDKTAAGADVRLSQINEVWSWPTPPVADSDERPTSEVLRREVYTKTMGGKLMVQKLLVWRSHKGEHGFGEYVMAYTNFSTGRAEPLTWDVRISSSEDQIMAMADAVIADKVKAGWKKVGE